MKSIKEKALQLYTSPACGQFGTGDYEEPEFDIDSFNEFMKGANYVLEQIENLTNNQNWCAFPKQSHKELKELIEQLKK